MASVDEKTVLQRTGEARDESACLKIVNELDGLVIERLKEAFAEKSVELPKMLKKPSVKLLVQAQIEPPELPFSSMCTHGTPIRARCVLGGAQVNSFEEFRSKVHVAVEISEFSSWRLRRAKRIVSP